MHPDVLSNLTVLTFLMLFILIGADENKRLIHRGVRVPYKKLQFPRDVN
jgi:hypothetical protein